MLKQYFVQHEGSKRMYVTKRKGVLQMYTEPTLLCACASPLLLCLLDLDSKQKDETEIGDNRDLALCKDVSCS